MWLQTDTDHARRLTEIRLRRRDRLAYGGIIGSALICLALLMWGHLGLGALVLPPTGASGQVAHAEGVTVGLHMNAPALTVGGPNTVLLDAQDAQGKPIEDGRIVVQLRMTDMAMDAPAVVATEVSPGLYQAHPRFDMAGDWRLIVEVTPHGGAPVQCSFVVAVRWQ